MSVKIENSWHVALDEEFGKPYFENIRSFIYKEKAVGKTIFPPGSLIFNAFEKTPLPNVKVVIIGQDPYHGVGQAMGLSFSVPKGVTIPASLVNIYKEINDDLGLPIPIHGDLTKWAEQGVFLLNAMLTVEQGKPASHEKIGWQIFTDAVIQKISAEKTGVVFLLWGKFAQNKKDLIDASKHFILEAAHPSPLARGAFFGCKHFSKTNEILKKQHSEPIDWSVD